MDNLKGVKVFDATSEELVGLKQYYADRSQIITQISQDLMRFAELDNRRAEFEAGIKVLTATADKAKVAELLEIERGLAMALHKTFSGIAEFSTIFSQDTRVLAELGLFGPAEITS